MIFERKMQAEYERREEERVAAAQIARYNGIPPHMVGYTPQARNQYGQLIGTQDPSYASGSHRYGR